MKYRRLSDKELLDLERDFINFLAANTVTSEDWINIKAQFPDKAEKLIEMFSDLVMDKVLSEIEILETRTRDSIQYLEFTDNTIVMTGIRVLNNPSIDFRQYNSSEQLSRSIKEHGGSLQLLSASKKISQSENEDKFSFLESHYHICEDKSLYLTLKDLVQEHYFPKTADEE